MRYLSLLATFVSAALAASSPGLTESRSIYLETVDAPGSATLLAEIEYNPSTLDSEIVSYNAPEISSDSDILRLGIYDEKTSAWKSATTVTSAASFDRGFRPNLIVSLDAQGDIQSVVCKSGKVDAGQTRDFGPKLQVVQMGKGKKPELNRPVVLKEGKMAEEVPEKTFLQKYWWVMLGVTVLMMSAGGAPEEAPKK